MNGVSNTARGLALAALVVVLCLLIGSANGAVVPANNGAVAYKTAGNAITTTTPGCSISGPVYHPAVSPDDSQLAFDDGTNIYTVPVSNCAATPTLIVAGTEPSWSPDGTTLAYISSSNNVWTINGGTTSQRTFTNDASDPAFAPASAGSLIAYIAGGTALNTITATGTLTTTSISSSLTAAGSPTWSPDGGQIALSAGVPSQIGIVSAGGGTPVYRNDGHPDTEPAWSPDGTLIAFATSTGISTMDTSAFTFAPLTSTPGDTQPDWQTAPPTIITGTSNLPLITGTTPPVPGTVLTGSTSAFHWNGSPTKYSFQWFRCNPAGTSCTTSIQGPSTPSAVPSSTYTVTAADTGDPIVVVVTASNIAGNSAPVQSLPAGAVAGAAPANVTKPVISGQPKAFPGGASVSATTGTWSGNAPITFTYQWQYCDYLTPPQCADIPLATSSFYSPTGDYIGKRLQVIVTATNGAGTATATSAFSFPVTGEQPRNTVSPRITGTIEVSSTLTADIGTWSGSVPLHYTYQWQRCGAHGSNCVDIQGATSTSYLLQPADYGSTIVFKVIAVNGAGAGVGQSIPTSPIRHRTLFGPANTNPPTLAGKPVTGSTLVGDPGTWTGEPPLNYTYTWLRCDANGGSCTGIPNAAGKLYKIRLADVGSTIKFLVTTRNAVGSASVNSDPTDVITKRPPQPKGRRIVGTKKNDYLAGKGGNDTILGLGGNDTILGGAGDDLLRGGNGNDVINGGPGADKIFGEAGSDTIVAQDGERDVIDCGAGQDRATVDPFDVVKNCEIVITPTAQLRRRG